MAVQRFSVLFRVGPALLGLAATASLGLVGTALLGTCPAMAQAQVDPVWRTISDYSVGSEVDGRLQYKTVPEVLDATTRYGWIRTTYFHNPSFSRIETRIQFQCLGALKFRNVQMFIVRNDGSTVYTSVADDWHSRFNDGSPIWDVLLKSCAYVPPAPRAGAGAGAGAGPGAGASGGLP